jgi:hypothetical protein
MTTLKIVKWTRAGETPIKKEANSWVIPTDSAEPNSFIAVRIDDKDILHISIEPGKFVRLNLTRNSLKEMDSE